MTHILLAGNPNCGKTTLFNALTNERQRVGNWPGVTVEKKIGFFDLDKQVYTVSDLPGIYSLNCDKAQLSEDQKITARCFVESSYDLIINVIDACHLERHLYLTSQLLELQKPMVIVLNMMDMACAQNIEFNLSEFERLIGCAVIPIQAHKNINVEALKQALTSQHKKPHALTLNLPIELTQKHTDIQRQLPENFKAYGSYVASRVLEGDNFLTAYDFNLDDDSDIICANDGSFT